DQSAAIAFPALPSTRRAIVLAHQFLLKIVGSPAVSVMTVLIISGAGRQIGAFTFERHRGRPFNEDTMRLAEAIASLLGPFFALHLNSHRLFAGRIVDLAGDVVSKLVGPRRPALKLGALGITALVIFLALAEGEHRVTAKAVLEGEVQRAA